MNLSTNTKKPWTVEEDSLLTELVLRHGTTNWTEIADMLSSAYSKLLDRTQCQSGTMLMRYSTTELQRSGKQCRERWHNHLNPEIKKGEWTESEDQLILCMQRQLGNQWAKIAKHLQGRSDNAIKNRFHAIIRARASQMPVPVEMLTVTPTKPTASLAIPSIAMPANVLPTTATINPSMQINFSAPNATLSANPLCMSIDISEVKITEGFHTVNCLIEPNKAHTSPHSFTSTSQSYNVKHELLLGGADVDSPFDRYCADKDNCSKSPLLPTLMVISPITVDEEFLEYWGSNDGTTTMTTESMALDSPIVLDAERGYDYSF